MEARPLPAFNSKKRKSIHPTRQLLDLHLQTRSGGPRRAEKKELQTRRAGALVCQPSANLREGLRKWQQ